MKIFKNFHSKWDKFFALILFIIAIVYDISPADIVPDFIPFAGWSDDIIVTIMIFINAYLKWRKKR